jgi:hypothetical protein
MAFFEHDFAEGTQQIHLYRVLSFAGGGQIEGLVQQADGSVDITGTPESYGQIVHGGKRLWIAGAE